MVVFWIWAVARLLVLAILLNNNGANSLTYLDVKWARISAHYFSLLLHEQGEERQGI